MTTSRSPAPSPTTSESGQSGFSLSFSERTHSGTSTAATSVESSPNPDAGAGVTKFGLEDSQSLLEALKDVRNEEGFGEEWLAIRRYKQHLFAFTKQKYLKFVQELDMKAARGEGTGRLTPPRRKRVA